MTKFVLVQCCPVPQKLAPKLTVILHESGASLQSCYRANDVEHMLEQCGKHSQTWLYDHQGTPIQPNPANKPGQSTHELRNDGVAYRGPKGMPLPYWCVGIDIDDAHVQSFIATARRHGYIATITYPGSRFEYHHVNFRKEPKFVLLPLKRGAKRSIRVWTLKKNLRKLGYLKGIDPRPGFGLWLYDGVVAFQKAHHLTPDGIVGPATQLQIKASLRHLKSKSKGK